MLMSVNLPGKIIFSILLILSIVNMMSSYRCRPVSKFTLQRSLSLSMSGTFYESIGSPKFISAPMVDQSNLAWRLLVRENGADLAFSQMMHARNFMTDKNYRSDCVDWDDYTHSGGTEEAERSKKLDGPLIVQLAGDDPHVLVEAGKYLHHDVAAIDLNLGCPQKIAKKGNYGAYLLPDKALIVKLLTAMVQNLDCPITAKVRCLSTDKETLELCRAIEDCGVSMITVHGRTVDSNKLFVTPANWDIIRQVKNSLSIPVIANGGIACRDDAIRCMEITGADGVMSSEGLLGNPKMFSEEGDRLFREDFARSQLQTADDFLRILESHKLPRPLFQVVRSHLFKILYRFSDAPKNMDLRRLLADGNFEVMKNTVVQFRERISAINYDTELGMELGLIGRTDWYYRHRDEKAQLRINSIPRKKIIRSAVDLRAPALVPIEVKKENGDELSLKLKLLKEKLSERKLREESNSEGGNEKKEKAASFSGFMSKMTD